MARLINVDLKPSPSRKGRFKSAGNATVQVKQMRMKAISTASGIRVVSLTASPLARTIDLIGGTKTIGRKLETPTDVHDRIVEGLPSQALDKLLARLETISQADALELGIGVSLRTHQRAKISSDKPLSTALSGRTWTFASIVAQASYVFGSQREAENWLQKPSLALDQRTPISLLATPEGVDMVKTILGRIEHGVYT